MPGPPRPRTNRRVISDIRSPCPRNCRCREARKGARPPPSTSTRNCTSRPSRESSDGKTSSKMSRGRCIPNGSIGETSRSRSTASGNASAWRCYRSHRPRTWKLSPPSGTRWKPGIGSTCGSMGTTVFCSGSKRPGSWDKSRSSPP